VRFASKKERRDFFWSESHFKNANIFTLFQKWQYFHSFEVKFYFKKFRDFISIAQTGRSTNASSIKASYSHEMLINPMQEHGVLHNLYCIMHKNESIEVFYFLPLHEIEDWLIYLYALYKDLFGFYLMFMQIMSLFFHAMSFKPNA